MNVVLMGPPGSGKGTQAELIQTRYEIPHISTGDMLRSEIRAGSTLGQEAKAFIEQGALVPDEVVIAMVKERIQKDDCKKGILLDGFPRTLEQADALERVVHIHAAINIEVPFDRLSARITGRRVCSDCGATYHVSTHAGEGCDKCGAKLFIRKDDRMETVEERLDVYQARTRPLLQYYKERGVRFDIDGDRPVEEVFLDISRALEKRL